MLGAIAAGFAGCGASHTHSARELALARADFIVICRTLQQQEPSVRAEVAATKAAWPFVANGLPADPHVARVAIGAAAARAGELRLPKIFEEQQAASITGPGSSVAGTFRAYAILAAQGWTQIHAAVEQSEHGPSSAAAFARANVALYIESVYDAHFGLAQIGKHLLTGYKALGDAATFGSSLTPAELEQLARTYSEASDRLQPHTGVKLGS